MNTETDFFNFKFYEWESKTPHAPFLVQPYGNQTEVLTWKQAGVMARKMASALQGLGFNKGAHIGLISKNCKEWVVADIAIVMAGYVSVPFFSNLNAAQLKQLLSLGDVQALFVGKVEDWAHTSESLPADFPIIAFPHYEGHSVIKNALEWETLLEKNEPLLETHQPLMSAVWSIIFTSGTTGVPKGVVIDYNALEQSKCSVLELNPTKTDMNGDNRYFSYLPLNHIAERLVVAYNCIRFGGVIYFNESVQSFSQNLKEAKPTTFFAVPRILTKFKQSIEHLMSEKLTIALSNNTENAIKAKKEIQTALGLQKVRALISGAAPLSETLKNWYAAIGLPITNGYGMTENCAISTILLPGIDRPGSVGIAQPKVALKLAAGTNEILMKAPFLMKGYYKRPDLTHKTLVGGWLRTGDQGHIDTEGFLYITGRINDTFKTSKGKFIVPSQIESKFLKCELLDQICLVGLGCPQPILLVNLSTAAQTLEKETLQTKLSGLLVLVNKTLHNYERISSIVVTKALWNVDNGLLTPTLKIKRSTLNERYKNELLDWQESFEHVIWEV